MPFSFVIEVCVIFGLILYGFRSLRMRKLRPLEAVLKANGLKPESISKIPQSIINEWTSGGVSYQAFAMKYRQYIEHTPVQRTPSREEARPLLMGRVKR